MGNICDQFGPTANEIRVHDQIILGPIKKKKQKKAQAASMASTKDDHWHASQAKKCSPSNSRPSKETMGVSGHSLAPSLPQNENNVRLHPPDLVDEDDNDQPRIKRLQQPAQSNAAALESQIVWQPLQPTRLERTMFLAIALSWRYQREIMQTREVEEEAIHNREQAPTMGPKIYPPIISALDLLQRVFVIVIMVVILLVDAMSKRLGLNLPQSYEDWVDATFTSGPTTMNDTLNPSAEEGSRMKTYDSEYSISSIIDEDEGDMKVDLDPTKMDPMVMAFNPLSSHYCIVNNAIPSTNAIRRGVFSAAEGKQMKDDDDKCSIPSTIDKDEGDTQRPSSKTSKTKLNPMAMAFIPLSSRCQMANNASPPTNVIRRGALIGIPTTAYGGKAQPIREQTGVSGHSLTTSPPRNEHNACSHPPKLVDENQSEEDGDNLLASSSLIENDKDIEGGDDPDLCVDIHTPHEPHTPAINNEYRVLAGKILSTKKGKRKNVDRPRRYLTWLKQSAREKLNENNRDESNVSQWLVAASPLTLQTEQLHGRQETENDDASFVSSHTPPPLHAKQKKSHPLASLLMIQAIKRITTMHNMNRNLHDKGNQSWRQMRMRNMFRTLNKLHKIYSVDIRLASEGYKKIIDFI